ncbi:MAG: hypothetical protein ACOCXH_04185 [Cyclobacteriaceae bacterium]
MINSHICTLFEGNYHYGVGALANSLCQHGYQGILWAGYKGDLPPWAKELNFSGLFNEFRVNQCFSIRFVKIDTDSHLTNFKPDFMLNLWKDYCPGIQNLFYFDPDIVVKCAWPFFERWCKFGVALCEDVISPVYEKHPIRQEWIEFSKNHGFKFNSNTDLYFNAGFIGLNINNRDFLVDWRSLKNEIGKSLGGLNISRLNHNTIPKGLQLGIPSTFLSADQDGLNITAMIYFDKLSFIGKEAMDIRSGGKIMSHAIGNKKPWNKNYLRLALRGRKPTITDKLFWNSVESPIPVYNQKKIKRIKRSLHFAKFIGSLVK